MVCYYEREIIDYRLQGNTLLVGLFLSDNGIIACKIVKVLVLRINSWLYIVVRHVQVVFPRQFF